VLCKGSRGGRGRGGEKEGRGNGEGAKVARTAGGKAAGAWVIGGCDGRRHAVEDGCDGKALRCGAGERHQH